MRCEICGAPIACRIVILPIVRKRALNTIACLNCARKQDCYCQEHDCPHLGFQDGTSCCLNCLKDGLGKISSEEWRLIFNQLKRWLPEEEFSRLAEFEDWTVQARILLVGALRRRRPLKDFVGELIKENSLDFLFGEK